MSSGKHVTNTTENFDKTQTAAPPSWTMPGIQTASNDVLAALGQIPTDHYSGQQVAYYTPEQLKQIQDAYTGTATTAGDLSSWMQGQLPALSTPWNWTTTLPDTSYNVGNMYDVNPVIDAALRPVYNQLTQQVLPGIKSSALDAGAYTGDRATTLLPQLALQDYARQAADTAATIGYQNYNDYENRRLQAYNDVTQNAIGAYQAESQRGLGQEQNNNQAMAAIGDYVNNILHTSASVGDLLKMSSDLGVNTQQQQINDALARDKYASYAPFMGLDEASQLLATLSGNWGTQTASGTDYTHQVQKYVPGTLDWINAGIGIASAVAGMPGIGGIGGAAGGAGGSGIMISPTANSQLGSALFS